MSMRLNTLLVAAGLAVLGTGASAMSIGSGGCWGYYSCLPGGAPVVQGPSYTFPSYTGPSFPKWDISYFSRDPYCDPGLPEDPSPVPLPAAGWMMLAGLGGLGAMRRKKKA